MKKDGLDKSEKIGALIIVLVIGFILIVGFAVSKNESKNTETTTTTTSIRVETSTTESTTRYYSGVPYEGMPESQVEYTSLGRADEVKLCTDFYKLNAKHKWKEYKWKSNGTTIFKVTIRYYDWKADHATSGFVRDICDWRDSVTYTYRATTKKRTTTTDPYNAKDYQNEDDFYEDHYDDFYDYYDAEEYYNDHYDD